MCIYVGGDSVLANLLNYNDKANEGFSCTDIEKYCEKIKSEIADDTKIKENYICFEISSDDIAELMDKYSDQFLLFQGKYYKNSRFSFGRFNWKNSLDIQKIMEKVAKAY